MVRSPCAALSAAIVVVSLLAVSLPARAQTQAPTVSLVSDATLDRIIAESVSARPELAQAQAVVHAEEERAPQAGALPDPMFQIGLQNDGFTSIEIGRMGTSYVSFMASQTFPWPGKLRLRKEIAKFDAARAETAVLRVRLSTEAEVRRTYLELLLVRDRQALLDQLEALWQQSFGMARAKYETGDGTQSDVMRAQLELNRLKLRRFALQAEERGRVQAINRLRVHPLDEPLETSSHVRDLPALTAYEGHFSVEKARARSPELATALLGTTRVDKSLALAEKSYYPDLTVGAGIMVRGAMPPMWVATVGAPLPLFSGSKQSRAVSESRAWATAAQQEVLAIEQLLRLRTEERRTAFSALVQTADLYRQSLLIQSKTTMESTISQYKVGKVPFASVLEANAGFLADQEAYLESVAAAHRLLIAEAEVSLAPTAMPTSSAGSSAMARASRSSTETSRESSAGGGSATAATGGSM